MLRYCDGLPYNRSMESVKCTSCNQYRLAGALALCRRMAGMHAQAKRAPVRRRTAALVYTRAAVRVRARRRLDSHGLGVKKRAAGSLFTHRSSLHKAWRAPRPGRGLGVPLQKVRPRTAAAPRRSGRSAGHA